MNSLTICSAESNGGRLFAVPPRPQGQRMAALLLGLAVLQLSWAVAVFAANEPLVAVLPLPATVQRQPGFLMVDNGVTVAIDKANPAAAAVAQLLIKRVMTERGLKLREVRGAAADIRLTRDATISAAEGYRLTIAADGVVIAASTHSGWLYGAMTLLQLLSPDDAHGQAVQLPLLTIDDAPRFAWRGLMIDVARHYQPIDSLHALIDAMAAVKLNTLHLHLSDDQGWRMEIKAYPRLTGVGAWRVPPAAGGKPAPRVGGFYTQAELKALVAHAATVGISIVPEIDLPGHAQALVAAYPRFGVLGDRPPVASGWGVFPYLLNPSPAGVAFVKAVLDEVIAVFPGTYIHLGGDEAIKDQWQRSATVQAQIKRMGLKDEEQLQSWLMNQFGEYLAAHGRRLIGWDEILDGGLPSSAAVMSWRGEAGAIEAANAHHDTVLSPMPTLYFDNLQSDRTDELTGRSAVQSLQDVYRYDPMPAGIVVEQQKFVLGAQANVWTEYLATPRQLQHMLFPRAAALAEITWSPRTARDFSGFLQRLDPQIRRWRRAGMQVADSAFAVNYVMAGTRGEALRKRLATLALSTQVPAGMITYTLDGSLPTARSSPYTAPLTVTPGVRIRAAAFATDGRALAAVRDFDTGEAALLTRSASELMACPGAPLRLRVPLHADASADAPMFNINQLDMCSSYPQAPLDFANAFSIEVARLPRELGLAHDAYKVRQPLVATTHGELVVSLGCPALQLYESGQASGPKPNVIASFALPDPADTPRRFRFTSDLPELSGDQDLCLQFTSPSDAVYYAVERVTLLGTRR